MFDFHLTPEPEVNGNFCMSQHCLAEELISFAVSFAVASITNKIENSSVSDEPEKQSCSAPVCALIPLDIHRPYQAFSEML